MIWYAYKINLYINSKDPYQLSNNSNGYTAENRIPQSLSLLNHFLAPPFPFLPELPPPLSMWQLSLLLLFSLSFTNKLLPWHVLCVSYFPIFSSLDSFFTRAAHHHLLTHSLLLAHSSIHIVTGLSEIYLKSFYCKWKRERNLNYCKAGNEKFFTLTLNQI